MENQLVIVLPDEVNDLAIRVSESKQVEVKNVLNQIFAGTSDWKAQADAIIVKDINDKMSIQLAEVGRKNVKAARLSAEKIFDAKREEVQQIKSEYDLEDKLWLKAKQTAQILFKDIENTFEWKAKYVERFEAEQKELRTQLRIEKVSKYTPELNRIEFENMSDEMFSLFFAGIEKAFNDKIEAEKKAESERLAKEKAETEERERIILENIRLKNESEEKEKALEEERKKQVEILAQQKAESDRLAKIEAEKQDKIQAELNAKLEAERKENETKLKAELEERLKIQKELEAKKKAEQDAIDKEIAAQKQRLIEEKKAAKAPDKKKLNLWVDSFQIPVNITVTGEANAIKISIEEKFTAFKLWARTQIENI
jgi:colicin import membrane protein